MKRIYTDRAKQWAKEYYIKNKPRMLEYYKANREKQIIAKRIKRGGNVEAPIMNYGERGQRIYGKKIDKGELKKLVLNIYGQECICCKENTIRFLSVDHINSDGHKEKSKDGTRIRGEALYRKLLRDGKRNDIQILCFNCNIGRQNNGGICPHKQ